MEFLIAPFEVSFVQRALWGGLLVSCVCALAGTWVVVRGMAFLGEAMAHGLLPGVAVASLLGGNVLLGAAFSAGAMAAGVTVMGRSARFTADTAIDLLTEKVSDAGRIPGISGIAADDRFAYPATTDTAHIVDGGAWTVDHGDHMHYYMTDVRELGALGHGGILSVHSDSETVTVITRTGTYLLDRKALDSGSIIEQRTLAGLAVPYASHLITVNPSGQAEVRARDGATLQPLPEPCPNPRGSATTRRGIVFGCADGALVVTADEGVFTAEKIAYPGAVPEAERPTAFTHRPGSTTVVARAGDRGVWLLDLRSGSWRLLDIGPVIAANTAGEGSALLALTADGVLHGYDVTTGAETARTPLLSAPVPGTAVIEIDANRAYINDPQAKAVHEIDYRDNLRRARTFSLDIAPAYLVETGR
ncbi:metal ABC transporter permease [Nocardia huaxiensis]|uniref:metal ABC transporter permease n=1 Tax=Nocardia huaxiensis TaxID=2755382 RepID=UPI001E659064|nr:metal ABC transporter permease [Nocardia huaxiensis]UFS99613.1 metal ABC transporter permease [Nocardia huaxiensis]